MSKIKENNNKIAGAVGTVVVHLLLLLAIYFFGLSTVVPPVEDGLTVNFGDGDTGEGLFEPAPASEILEEVDQSAVETSVPEVTPVKAELTAQEIEESLEVKQKREEERRQREEQIRKQKELEARAQKASSTTKNAFKGFGGKGTDESAKSQGEAGGSGNQGSPDGTVNGVSYTLTGRKALSVQKPPYNQNIEGYIVVEIEVNPQGKVISAKAGAKGTTISDATMRKIAEQTAFKTKFTGTTENNIQVGTITYKYVLE